MGLLRRSKVGAFRARLQVCEDERRRIVETAMRSQVSLAKITGRLERVDNDIRILTRELKLLEIPESEA